MKDRSRISFLTTLDFANLNEACKVITEAFGSMPMLVGSVMEDPEYRDVDLRTILDDEEFDAIFGDRQFFWALFCMAVSSHLRSVTGLPVDYQVQRMTEANAKYGGGVRNPFGAKARLFAGGGDGTPWNVDAAALIAGVPRTPRCPECGMVRADDSHVCGPSIASVDKAEAGAQRPADDGTDDA